MGYLEFFKNLQNTTFKSNYPYQCISTGQPLTSPNQHNLCVFILSQISVIPTIFWRCSRISINTSLYPHFSSIVPKCEYSYTYNNSDDWSDSLNLQDSNTCFHRFILALTLSLISSMRPWIQWRSQTTYTTISHPR